MPTSRVIFAAIFMLVLPPAVAPAFAQGSPISITHSDIAGWKTALKLKPMQEVYWIPVAAALKALPAEGGSVAIDADTVDRLMPVLRPLLASLDEDQRRVAAALAQRIGLGRYASLI